ncbi:MAG: hypothetical protein E6G73_12935 [Alphaproteobacteria bacterium]|nr:MAG: hypothetical protein E6G73_12935 [Alphaproteobacteria bacterium]
MRRYRGSAFRQLADIGIVLALLLLSPIAPAAAAGPSHVIRGLYGVRLDTMQHAQQFGARGCYQKLEPVIFRTFDVPYMAKLSIGPGWNALTPEQKKQAAHAYGRYIAATYASLPASGSTSPASRRSSAARWSNLGSSNPMANPCRSITWCTTMQSAIRSAMSM